MPIFEFRCCACGWQFERIVLPGRSAEASATGCPSCHAAEAERIVSAFAVSSDTTRESHLADGRQRAKKDLTEKRDADYKSYIDHVSEH
jgi:putative FmdB family regulatory protein